MALSEITPSTKRYVEHVAALIDRAKAGDEFAETSLWCLQILDKAYKMEVLATKAEAVNTRRSR
jgi:hypothetical protein